MNTSSGIPPRQDAASLRLSKNGGLKGGFERRLGNRMGGDKEGGGNRSVVVKGGAHKGVSRKGG